MSDFIRANISGIKCDNKECKFRDKSVKFEEYKDYINKPCPECGSNLLTEEDYESAVKLLEKAQTINKFFGLLNFKKGKEDGKETDVEDSRKSKDDFVRLGFDSDGSGKLRAKYLNEEDIDESKFRDVSEYDLGEDK